MNMKKKIVMSVVLGLTLMLSFMFWSMPNGVVVSLASSAQRQHFVSNPSFEQRHFLTTVEQISLADATVYSTATLEDNFTEDIVLVSMNRIASRDFREMTTSDFPEVRLVSVKDITPGLELAEAQLQARQSYRENSFYYDPSWAVDLDNFRRILVLTLANPGRENVLEAINVLERRCDVRSATPNFIADMDHCYYLETDILIAGVHEALSSALWNIDNIQAPKAWSVTSGSSDVVIGLISTGIRRTHTELIGRTYERLSRNFHTDGQSPWYDNHGHGTHIAGTLVGRSVGVAPNSMVSSLRVAGRNADGSSSYQTLATIRSIEFASNPQTRIPILSMSASWSQNVQAKTDAISAFPGLFVVAAANNNREITSSQPTFPAMHRMSNLISVGALNSDNERATNWIQSDGSIRGSNWSQAYVCIFAPGENVRSSVQTGDNAFSNWRGTSMATPHVAGVAALMLSVNPNLGAEDIRNAIVDSGDTITIHAPSIGNHQVRRLNAYGAVRMARDLLIPEAEIWDGTIAPNFAGGTGTASDPWQISNGAELARLAQQNNASTSFSRDRYFVLTANVYLNNPIGWQSWDEHTQGLLPWTPIGNTLTRPFRGNFDGRGFAVRGLYISRPTETGQGLFRELNTATVRNLRVEQGFVRGSSHVGAIAASVRNSMIINSYNSARVVGGNITGGLVGYLRAGSVVDSSHNAGNILGVGGLVGSMTDATIVNSTNSGTITNNTVAGGIVGTFWSGNVMNNLNMGTIRVTGGNSAGGIVGLLSVGSHGEILNNSNIGVLEGNRVGGIVGDALSSAQARVEFNYFLKTNTINSRANFIDAVRVIDTTNNRTFNEAGVLRNEAGTANQGINIGGSYRTTLFEALNTGIL